LKKYYNERWTRWLLLGFAPPQKKKTIRRRKSRFSGGLTGGWGGRAELVSNGGVGGAGGRENTSKTYSKGSGRRKTSCALREK